MFVKQRSNELTRGKRRCAHDQGCMPLFVLLFAGCEVTFPGSHNLFSLPGKTLSFVLLQRTQCINSTLQNINTPSQKLERRAQPIGWK